MSETAAKLSIEIVQGIDAVAPNAWDALVPPDDPFCTHAFLSVLEDSGSAARQTGWIPAHVLVRAVADGEPGPLLAATPAYVKDHSYGEYIFDWGWAQASQRAGLAYYPKVVSAVPFTPATGRRLLVAEDAPFARDVLERVLLDGLRHVADAAEAMSLHVLFCTEGERERGEVAPELVGRVTTQFHWHDAGYGDFEGWLSTFRSRARKETRRERRKPEALGATVQVIRGAEMTAAHWAALHGFYSATVEKKWAREYLSPAFFQDFGDRLAPIAIALLAEVNGEYVAGALAFQRGTALFGRYWGCRPGFEPLHFELCYHRPIELCLENGWTRFEAGAQGHHKIKRGLMPAETHSLHWLRHPGLGRAVAEAVRGETKDIRAQAEQLACHGPFRRVAKD